MNETQYVSEINGYKIKDSEARSDIKKLNLTHFENLTFSTLNNGTIVGQNFKIAYDDSHTICKIYGRFVYNTSGESFTSETITATLPFTLTDDIIINPAGCRFTYNLAINNVIGVYGVTYNLSGNTLTISFNNDPETEGRHSIECPPCIYFLKDFGDTPDI